MDMVDCCPIVLAYSKESGTDVSYYLILDVWLVASKGTSIV